MSDIFHTNWHIDDPETWLTAGVTGLQGILTPPWHLIPPPVFPGVRVSPFGNSYLYFETDYSSVSWPFHTQPELMRVKMSQNTSSPEQRARSGFSYVIRIQELGTEI